MDVYQLFKYCDSTLNTIYSTFTSYIKQGIWFYVFTITLKQQLGLLIQKPVFNWFLVDSRPLYIPYFLLVNFFKNNIYILTWCLKYMNQTTDEMRQAISRHGRIFITDKLVINTLSSATANKYTNLYKICCSSRHICLQFCPF